MLETQMFDYIIKIKEKIQSIKSKNNLSLKSETEEIRIHIDPLSEVGIGLELILSEDYSENTLQMLKGWSKAKNIVFVWSNQDCDTLSCDNIEFKIDKNTNLEKKYINIHIT